MINDKKSVRPGVALVDPIGRRCVVSDVFVPRNQPGKSAAIPSSFRNLARKIVVFHSGGVMHLSDIERRYSLAS
ncbi:hypothetical protein P886_0387 [Alteromonadaceae bacterium 2753L.S.0a.02]|nr:hypothetical protein P886_0387 [Alteromonadaceae bacterium 2753L.S.0a.02]